jgi:hypothetical protein
MDINAIDITTLPSVKSIELTDKIYVFKLRENKYYVEKIDIAELSSFLYDKEMTDKFNAKYNELLELSSNFINYLKENFPTKEFVENTFITKKDFNLIYDDILNVKNLKEDILFEYTHKDVNSKYKQDSRVETEKLNRQYTRDIASEIVYIVPSE